jgi:hypothetical protein
MRQLLVLTLVAGALGCGKTSSEKTTTAKTLEDRTLWKKLAKGMTQDQVRSLMGEPLRVQSEAKVAAWYYQDGPPLERDEYGWVVPRGALLFSTNGGVGAKLTSWREP